MSDILIYYKRFPISPLLQCHYHFFHGWCDPGLAPNIAKVVSTPHQIIHIEDMCFGFLSGANATKSDSFINTMYHQPTPNRSQQTVRYKADEEKYADIH